MRDAASVRARRIASCSAPTPTVCRRRGVCARRKGEKLPYPTDPVIDEGGRHRRGYCTLDHEVLPRADGERGRGPRYAQDPCARAAAAQPVASSGSDPQESRSSDSAKKAAADSATRAAVHGAIAPPRRDVRRRRKGKPIKPCRRRTTQADGPAADPRHAARRHDDGVAERVADGDQRREDAPRRSAPLAQPLRRRDPEEVLARRSRASSSCSSARRSRCAFRAAASVS